MIKMEFGIIDDFDFKKDYSSDDPQNTIVLCQMMTVI